MGRWKAGGCPKCGGSTFTEKIILLDVFKDEEWYEHCLICGYMTPLKIVVRKENPNSDSQLVTKTEGNNHGQFDMSNM